MASDPQLFRVTPESQETHRLDEVDFAALGLREVQDIQEWVAANPRILGDDLLIIAKEYGGFDRTKERLDLLGVDSDGMLVIIELKRDDSGADVHWQAIKYASYLRAATPAFIVQRLAEHRNFSSTEEAETYLSNHLNAEELSGLNHEQRIILASHRFAPEVTSAVLWLNEKVGAPLITCVTLTPFRDTETGALYVQANTIIPVPGVAQYVVGVGDKPYAARLDAKKSRNSDDDVTQFVWRVAELVLQDLPDPVRPDKQGRWAAGWEHFRYFNLWYSSPPWKNGELCYHMSLRPRQPSGTWHVDVGLHDVRELISKSLKSSPLFEDQGSYEEGIFVTVGTETLTDDFANKAAKKFQQFIRAITPMVNAVQDQDNEQEA